MRSIRWSPSRPPLVPRADPDADPRASILSLVITAATVVAVRSPGFAAVLLGGLVAHEAAHRWVARRHGARVGYPIFLPAPVFVGTLGALLPVRVWPRSPSALVEVGASGPIAGAAVAAAVIAWRVGAAPVEGPGLPPPILWVLAGVLARGAPVPLPAEDPYAHGAWALCLVTGMNLLPIGQLDGGHLSSAVLGGRARAVGWGAAAAVAALGFRWHWWWPWLLALGALGGWRRVPVSDDPLTLRSRLVAGGAGAVGLACFLPIPG